MAKITMLHFLVFLVSVIVVAPFHNPNENGGAPFTLGVVIEGSDGRMTDVKHNPNNLFYRSIARTLKDDDPYIPSCHYVYDEATGTETGETCDGTRENGCDPECKCNTETGKCYAPACHMRQTCRGTYYNNDCIGECNCSDYTCFTQRDFYRPETTRN